MYLVLICWPADTPKSVAKHSQHLLNIHMLALLPWTGLNAPVILASASASQSSLVLGLYKPRR